MVWRSAAGYDILQNVADCERHACGDPRLEKAFAFLKSANLQGWR